MFFFSISKNILCVVLLRAPVYWQQTLWLQRGQKVALSPLKVSTLRLMFTCWKEIQTQLLKLKLSVDGRHVLNCLYFLLLHFGKGGIHWIPQKPNFLLFYVNSISVANAMNWLCICASPRLQNIRLNTIIFNCPVAIKIKQTRFQ